MSATVTQAHKSKSVKAKGNKVKQEETMSELEKLCKEDHDYWRDHGGPWLAPWDEYKKLYQGDYSTYRISSAADRRLGAPLRLIVPKREDSGENTTTAA